MKKELSELEKYDRRVSAMTHGKTRLSRLEERALSHVEQEFFARNSCGYFPGAAMGIVSICRHDGKRGAKVNR